MFRIPGGVLFLALGSVRLAGSPRARLVATRQAAATVLAEALTVVRRQAGGAEHGGHALHAVVAERAAEPDLAPQRLHDSLIRERTQHVDMDRPYLGIAVFPKIIDASLNILSSRAQRHKDRVRIFRLVATDQPILPTGQFAKIAAFPALGYRSSIKETTVPLFLKPMCRFVQGGGNG